MGSGAGHIGIVGCSAEGAALCYRTIVHEGAALLGDHAHPEISLHTPSFADYVECLEHDDLDGVAELMLESAAKLARAGADFLICPDNTIHAAFDRVAPRSPLPWLHIAEVVADEAIRREFHCLGVMGTQWLVDGPVYDRKLETAGIDCVKPEPKDRKEVGRIIMAELVNGVSDPISVAYLQGVIDRLANAGCDGVVLGCTELPLVLDDDNSSLPTLDSTRLLARAALRRAVEAR